MKGSFVIGRVAGIEISIHWTFFILLAVLLIPVKGVVPYWNAVFMLLIFACVVLHELGHALAAKHYGIITRDITLLPIGGVARLEKIPEKPRQELVVAIAGPMVNVLIAMSLIPFVHFSFEPDQVQQLAVIRPSNFLTNLFMVNTSLVAFNLLPAFPMDGGRVLRALLSFKLPRVKATRIAALIGQGIAVVFGVIGFFINPFLLFIGIFIFYGAQQEYLAVESKSYLMGHRVSDVTIHPFARLEASSPISEAVKDLLEGAHHDFVIYDNNQVVGTVGRVELVRGLSHFDAQTPVKEIMDSQLEIVPFDAPMEDALEKIQKVKSRILLVVKNNELFGLVDLENLVSFMMLQQAAQQRQSA
ncbi:MAG: site-2 protease family protein [Bacteroidetes bacterium]|nr:site-2 protease family protein [Bacteroidota bacterium]